MPEGAVPWLLVATVLLLVLAATLAAAEAAIGRLTRAEAAHLVIEGRRGASAVQAVVLDPAPVLSASTLLRVTAEAAAAVAATAAASALPWPWWTALLVTAAALGGASFVLLGVSPRTVGRQHPEGVALRTARRLRTATRLLGPLARALVALANAVTPGRGFRDGPFATEGELREMVDRASESSIIEDEEREMIHSVFELGETLVREVMSPRTDMVTVPAAASLREAMAVFLSSGHSRAPVVGESTDDVVGVLLLKDVARVLHERPDRLERRGSASGPRAADAARPAVFVPETKLVDALLREMQHEASHLALVVDEYGGIAGLVTLEDLLEEIVGEIADEYDREEPSVELVAEDVYRVSSRLPVDDLGDLFGLTVEDDEVDSVGGLLAKALGTVPTAGSQAVVAGLHLCADEVDGHRITTVVVRRAADDGDDGPPGDEPSSGEPVGEPVGDEPARTGATGAGAAVLADPAAAAGGRPHPDADADADADPLAPASHTGSSRLGAQEGRDGVPAG